MATFLHQDRFYFDKFPNVDYPFKTNGEISTITTKNLLKRISIIKELQSYASAWSYWTIRDQDTPQLIANKVYGSSHLYWVVLLMNDIHNPEFDWPLSEPILDAYVKKKYGADNVFNIHHHEALAPVGEFTYAEGTEVNDTYTHKKTITNYEYEIGINEAKREIRLLKPSYIDQVLTEFRTITNNNFSILDNI